MTPLTVGSTFTGVGGADIGFEQAGFTISWQCELDAWKRTILASHWPDVQIFDDITTMLDPPPVDILIGGFPCQDLSVAGQRKGFTGERSVLAFEFLRLAESIRPRWLVLENVPGLLSSSGGADFARLIDEVVACGFGVAWRILDARFFSVPQRRRRVFIVARRTDALIDSAEASRLALRALRESGDGDIAPGWKSRQDAPRGLKEGARGSCVCEPDPAGSLTKRYGKGVNSTLDDGSIVISDGGGLAFRKSRRAQSMTDDETWVEGDHANTLNSFDAGDVRTTHAVLAAFYSTGGSQQGDARTDEVSPTLKIGSGLGISSPVAIVNALDRQQGGPDDNSAQAGHLIPDEMSVRRLTPTEYERLMGWPDEWTAPEGVKAPDSKRYAACGDGIVAPVAFWIADRIKMIEGEA